MVTYPYRTKDLPTIIDWLELRGARLPSADEMPEFGFIAYLSDGSAVAAAFLRRVEGGFGQVDGLVSNPLMSSEDRHEGIDAVVTQVIEKAKELKLKGLIATTVDSGTLLRSTKHGFEKLPHSLMARSFT